jgi:hypothetical protein
MVGILLGGGGVLFLQASYGEKRLSIAETQKLTEELKNLSVEKQTLQTRVDEAQKVLDTEVRTRDTQIVELTGKLTKAESIIVPLREQLDVFAKTLVFDPRFGPIGISTSQITQEKNSTKLSYLVWLLQEIRASVFEDGPGVPARRACAWRSPRRARVPAFRYRWPAWW